MLSRDLGSHLVVGPWTQVLAPSCPLQVYSQELLAVHLVEVLTTRRPQMQHQQLDSGLQLAVHLVEILTTRRHQMQHQELDLGLQLVLVLVVGLWVQVLVQRVPLPGSV